MHSIEVELDYIIQLGLLRVNDVCSMRHMLRNEVVVLRVFAIKSQTNILDSINTLPYNCQHYAMSCLSNRL